MASFIHEVENNEALLLLFLSGELPDEDRAEVEQMLAADAGLADLLTKMTAEYDFALNSLAALDADHATAAGENHAIRQAKRVMRQWQIDRANRQPAPATPPRRQIPAWALRSGIAAVLLIGALTWWGIAGDSYNSAGSLAKSDTSGTGDATTQPIAADDMLENSLTTSGDSLATINQAEQSTNRLVAQTESKNADSSIFMVDSAQ